MLAILDLLGTFIANLFKSQRRLKVENLFLRHQLNIALRGAPHRLRLRGSDRALLVWMSRLWPSLLGLSRVVQPDTILRWHRADRRLSPEQAGKAYSRAQGQAKKIRDNMKTARPKRGNTSQAGRGKKARGAPGKTAEEVVDEERAQSATVVIAGVGSFTPGLGPFAGPTKRRPA